MVKRFSGPALVVAGAALVFSALAVGPTIATAGGRVTSLVSAAGTAIAPGTLTSVYDGSAAGLVAISPDPEIKPGADG